MPAVKKPKPDEPALLPKHEVAEMIARQIKSIEVEKVRGDIIRIANGHSEEDAIPGLDPPQTYGERRLGMTEQQNRIREGFSPDVVAVAEAMLRQRSETA